MTVRQALKLIGWKGYCRIRYNQKESRWLGMKRCRNGKPKIRDIHIGKYKCKNKILTCVLHECFHVLIEARHVFSDKSQIRWDQIYREYRVEKAVRKFAKKHNLKGVLYDSNKWVKRYINSDPSGNCPLILWPMDQRWYIYAARRIAAEEKLDFYKKRVRVKK